LLEIGFCSFIVGSSPCWVIWLASSRKSPKGVSRAWMSQLLDVLNTFVLLIVLLRDASSSVCLHRWGTGPLGHTFSTARIRGRGVTTMSKIISTFTSNTLACAIDSCLNLITLSHRQVSVKINYSPCSQTKHSIFNSGLKKTAAWWKLFNLIDLVHLLINQFH
jgi:hypothetical protein